MNMGSRQVGSYLVAMIGGLVVTGTLRAGDLLLSPLNVVFQGTHLIGVPEGVRALGHSRRRLDLKPAAHRHVVLRSTHVDAR